eukprot:gb/GFBE01012938.1/.p1 GENE.gb/GFBE01012938.1/~~gb/GFBE01012938.1/.p1  ORF type:complete len:545 (+),score=134.79 gb/GFBE01012938.1/:1-1635(+)
MTRRAAVAAAALALAGLGLADAQPAVADLQRAKTKKPRDAYRGEDQAALSKVLNQHLARAEERVRSCAEWAPEQLQQFMHQILGERSDEFQDIYSASKDRRQLRFGSAAEYRSHWEELNRARQRHPHLLEPLRESHCRQAVMWWTHHLTEEARGALRAKNVTVPLLPEGPKLQCGQGKGDDEHHACLGINEPNSCDWCHSTQAAHDAGVPGSSPPNALDPKYHGPDDGNPHGWDRKRRCDQDQQPRCQLCEGVGGKAWGDKNEEIELTPCVPLATPDKVNMSTVAPALYPKQFTVKRKDGAQGGYSDTLIGWKTDPFCFGFFPQNDSIKPLCYRSQDSYAKYYDIEKEAARTDYNVKLTGAFSHAPNITATILMVNDTMWVQNHLWVQDQCICTNPSGNHCTNPPCHSYVWNWDTFRSAQYLGREKIGAEWIQHYGTGTNAKMMELDHFIMWTHHAWTDPVSRRIVRMWKPFNGLQVYDPESWTDSVEDPSVFDSPPAKCKKGGAKIRIHCDDDGHYKEGKHEGLELLAEVVEMMKKGPQDIVV